MKHRSQQQEDTKVLITNLICNFYPLPCRTICIQTCKTKRCKSNTQQWAAHTCQMESSRHACSDFALRTPCATLKSCCECPLLIKASLRQLEWSCRLQPLLCCYTLSLSVVAMTHEVSEGASPRYQTPKAVSTHTKASVPAVAVALCPSKSRP